MKDSLTIDMLAKASEVNVETIRSYERKNILKQPHKQGTFRHYPNEYIDRINFIKRSQELGFSLKETKELLELKINNKAKCNDVLIKTEEKITQINQKINDLKKMKKSLEGLANCCVDRSQPLNEYPILESFVTKKSK